MIWAKNYRTLLLLVLIVTWTKLFSDDLSSNLAPKALTDINIYNKLMEREMTLLLGYKLRAEEWTTKLNGYKDTYDDYDEYDFTQLKSSLEKIQEYIVSSMQQM